MRLYNSLTRIKEDLGPVDREVGLYVCGVTVYDRPHIGHALSTTVFEVLHRYLEYRGFKVKRVQNFTDVDDKIIARANREGVAPSEVAEKYTAAFFDELDGLNVRRADLYPKATEHIPEIIDMISTLVDTGAAYESHGSVYFSVSADDDYGKLTRRSVEQMLEGTRAEVGIGKRAPADFALWKAARPDEPSWDSPWGAGRPGWHIECSAMARKHLGDSIDIHGGGLDLIFPHHENELAQSETATGVEPFARIWMHNGLLQLSDEKMSKSIGNIIFVGDALKRFSPDTLRLWMLSSHYRAPLRYEERAIDEKERAIRRLRSAIEAESSGSNESLDPTQYGERFIQVMDDDLNTPQAVAVLFDLGRDIFRARDSGKRIDDAQSKLKELSGVLGLALEDVPDKVDGQLSDEEVERLVMMRSELRKARRYADADAARATVGREWDCRGGRTERDYVGPNLTCTSGRQFQEW